MKAIKRLLVLATLLGMVVLGYEIIHWIAPHLPFFGQGAQVAMKGEPSAPTEVSGSQVTTESTTAATTTYYAPPNDISGRRKPLSTVSQVPSYPDIPHSTSGLPFPSDISEHHIPPVAESIPPPPIEPTSTPSPLSYPEHFSQSHNHFHGTHSSSHSGTSSGSATHQSLHAHHPSADERYRAFARTMAERERFALHIGPIRFVPTHRAVLLHTRIVPTTYYYRREVFYDTYSWQPPAYVYRLSPRYGLFDATFLAFAIDHISEEQYAAMLYNHQHEPEIHQWMSDTSRLAADNPELRKKLDVMKAKMSALEEAGVGTDPSFVPPDAQDIVLSPEIIAQLTSSN